MTDNEQRWCSRKRWITLDYIYLDVSSPTAVGQLYVRQYRAGSAKLPTALKFMRRKQTYYHAVDGVLTHNVFKLKAKQSKVV